MTKFITFLIDFELCILPALIFYIFLRIFLVPLFPSVPDNMGTIMPIVASMISALGNAIVIRKSYK
jgi:mannose/fructose/N-acetylgalactosamine-specific phosphotransferase system component IIC